MTVAAKNKTPLVVPVAIRRQAGFKRGQEIEFKVSKGVISIRPKLPAADEEYTAEQRRGIDAQLAKGLGGSHLRSLRQRWRDDRPHEGAD